MQYNITYREKDKGIQYIISYKDRSGRWRQKSKQGFAKMSEAKKAALKKLDEIKEKFELQLDAELEGISFQEFTEMFLENMRLYKEPNTVKTYEQTVNKFADLGRMEVSKISSVHVQKCVDNMVRDGLAPSTIKAHVTRLKTIFKSAISPYRIITDNPVSDLILPQKKESAKIKALNLSDLENLLSRIKNYRYYLMSLLAGKCGLRLGEIIGLTWNDVNFEKCTIDINKQWKKGKNGKYGFGSLKSKSSYRVVPAPKSVLRALAEYKKISPASIDRRIFTYAQEYGIGTAMANCYKSLGYDISIHDLRHTFATLLIANGTDFRTAAQILGHTPEETIRTYSHVTSDMMERAAKTINNIFG